MPMRGDAAVQPGNPGHVAFVEAVYADGSIRVSEYNRSFEGTYDDTRIGTRDTARLRGLRPVRLTQPQPGETLTGMPLTAALPESTSTK